jgi:chloramphenicol O-acetyltransferase type B
MTINLSLSYIVSRLLKKLRLPAIVGSDIHPTAAVESGSHIVESTLERHTFCGYDCSIINAQVGPFCSIASRVTIGGAAHPMEYVSTSPVFLSHRDSVKTKFARHHYSNIPRTIVGADVWIGSGAFLRSGVTIGVGAVIGMGAVVARNVAPYTVVAGNPARVVSERFPPEIVSALLKSEWWNFSDEELKRHAVDFTDPCIFLNKRGLL